MMVGLKTAHPENTQNMRAESNARDQLFSFGPQIQPDGSGVLFRLWAPSAQQISLVLSESDAKALPMQRDEQGWFSILVSEAKHGTLYQFHLEDGLLV